MLALTWRQMTKFLESTSFSQDPGLSLQPSSTQASTAVTVLARWGLSRHRRSMQELFPALFFAPTGPTRFHINGVLKT